MEEEKYFDYSRGLTAPYWIQEIKTSKGKLLWYFSTPMQLSFFIVFFLILVLMLTIFSVPMQLLNRLTHSISLLLYWFVPYRLSKFYTEYEPQGKKMHTYIWDYLVYLIDYGFNKKAIYQGERVEVLEEIVFEKTNI
ncbi:conjugal transfer protein [Streptococcus agalactiae]|uniref:conjugal transfer protein n=1 Tax=Streptococcus agalactiae TaxID=1311 RepID=UPI00186615E5|nr:conjugal transfer protein [Streptococcus agalactiae]MBE3600357.1 conjugal transfer protein [Streptococcus agalactiae]